MRDLVLVWWVFVACLLNAKERDAARREDHFCLSMLGGLSGFKGGYGGAFPFLTFPDVI